MQRTDAAYGLAVLVREIAEKAAVYSFSDRIVEVPARRGFALRDAIDASQRHNGTLLGNAVDGRLGELKRSGPGENSGQTVEFHSASSS